MKRVLFFLFFTSILYSCRKDKGALPGVVGEWELISYTWQGTINYLHNQGFRCYYSVSCDSSICDFEEYYITHSDWTFKKDGTWSNVIIRTDTVLDEQGIDMSCMQKRKSIVYEIKDKGTWNFISNKEGIDISRDYTTNYYPSGFMEQWTIIELNEKEMKWRDTQTYNGHTDVWEALFRKK